LYNATERPAYSDQTIGHKVVLGTSFISHRSCTIKAIRYYKAEGEVGQHTGYLYSQTGEILATTGSFEDLLCRGPGWIQVSLLKPFQTSAGQEYVVAMDAATYYPLTEYYAFQDKAANWLEPLGGKHGMEPGCIPDGESGENFWVDGTSQTP
jgi:hypothetical protein